MLLSNRLKSLLESALGLVEVKNELVQAIELNPAEFPEIDTPDDPPDAGNNLLYFKDDNNLYSMDSDGNEFLIVSTSGTPWGSITGTLSNQTDLQNALDAKAPEDAPSFTTSVTLDYATGSTVPVLDSSKNLISSAVSDTELGYLDGVTSGIQNQLDAKAPIASPAFTTQITFGNYHLEPSEYDSGNSGSTKTIDFTDGSAQLSTLTSNCTYTLTNGVVGGSYALRILGGTGGFSVDITNVTWLNATSSSPNDPGSAEILLISLYTYDGTNYLASFAGNYAA